MFTYTAQDVKARRDATGRGLCECKAEIEREQIGAAIEGIRNGNHDWRLVADILDALLRR